MYSFQLSHALKQIVKIIILLFSWRNYYTWMWILHTTLLSFLLWCNYFQRPATGIFTWINDPMNRTTKHVPKKKKIHKQQNCLICFLFHIWLLVLEQGKHICNSNCRSITSTSKSLPLHNQDIAYSNSIETKQKKKSFCINQ